MDVESFNIERVALTVSGLHILLAWGILNCLSLLLLFRLHQNKSWVHFFQMCAAWGFINGLIALYGQYDVRSEISLTEAGAIWEAQKQIESLLLFNSGLDLIYVLIGILLIKRAFKAANPDRLMGFGRAIILQGSFLFVFDLGFWWAQHQHAIPFEQLMLS